MRKSFGVNSQYRLESHEKRTFWQSVNAQAPEVGETTVSLPARCTTPGQTAMNITYLLEYFKGKEGSVTVSITENKGAPATFAHRGTPHIIIVPMLFEEE